MPSQAAQFFDLYLEAPVDISRVLWLATAGGLRYLNPP
jgi:ATP-dependent Lon protease